MEISFIFGVVLSYVDTYADAYDEVYVNAPITPNIKWDVIGDRVYQTGLDRGVLYLTDAPAVAWNGLTSVTEQSGRSAQEVYFDGRKVGDVLSISDFAGTIKALTYPDELTKLEGLGSTTTGIYFGDQPASTFDLSYRTKVGNDIDESLGYKIHILYNVTATPSNKSYNTNSDSPEAMEFEWDISAIPEEAAGIRPTAHVIIDSRKIDPTLLSDIETVLYGIGDQAAAMIPMVDLVSYLFFGFKFKLIDNLDGTWTVHAPNAADITLDPVDSGKFTLNGINGSMLSTDTYSISTTMTP